ncbi:MAG: hypothetical protein DMF69_02510, partial [Acidobacteria bacterium]
HPHSTDDHFVQFYESDGFLIDSIADYIVPGLKAGENAVVLATDPHLRLLKPQLEKHGLNVSKLISQGRYSVFDADETLGKLMIDEKLSPDRFRSVFGGEIARATDLNRPLRVFGELVAVLWAKGQQATALEVEELWNELLQKKQFSLFCAYPIAGFRGDDLAEPLKQVCRTHSRVTPTESYSALTDTNDKLLSITLLQQKALSLEKEIVQHTETEARLQTVKEELEIQLAKSAELLEREKRARSEAEVANRMKDEFLATVSHELRTPLNAIIGWSHMLRRGRLNEATTARAIESIERNSKAQAQLIEDILDVSRAITGKLRLNLASVDASTVIDSAIDSVQLAADSKQIELVTILDPAVEKIVGDASRLQQIVWNLLSNAIKFTPPNGKVIIQLRQVESTVEISVNDNGQGIAPEFQPCVFERFRQVDASSTRLHGGLGLGLAIVRHLVELHGGEVSVSSEGLGLGSTFTIRLPSGPSTAQACSECAGHPEVAVSSSTLAGLRVLVVGEDSDDLQVLVTTLGQRGVFVQVANGTNAAMGIYGWYKPQLLVFDLDKCCENGFCLLSSIRERESNSETNTPAVALTRHILIENRAQALAAGFDMFVPKPIQPAELLAAISNLVNAHFG